MAYDARANGADCDACPLRGQTVVPPTFVKKPRLAIVGMAPGRIECSKGEGFVGPSGKVLDGALREAGVDRGDCHISNAILCRPDNDEPPPEALAACSMRLARELAALPKETLIMPLGKAALKATVGKTSIQKCRGFIWTMPTIEEKAIAAFKRSIERLEELPPTVKRRSTIEKRKLSLRHLEARQVLAGRQMLPSVHPAFILRGAAQWRPVFNVDIKKAARFDGRLEDEVPYVETCNIAEARRLLRDFGDTVTVDVETDGPNPMTAELTCVGICDAADVSRVVILSPWKRALAPVLASALRNRTVITHNGPSFDEIVLERYGVRYTKKEDTLLAHHAFASSLPHRLDHVASMYVTASPWKIDFRSKSKGAEEKGFGVASDDLAKYNAADVALDALAWQRMQPDLSSELDVYKHDMRLADMCRRMQIAGIRVDADHRDVLSKRLRGRASALKGEMRRIIGRRSFSPTKLDEIRRALFGRFKAPKLFFTPTGALSTANGTLEALRYQDTRAGHLADALLRWREATKLRSTFVEGIEVHTDGRVHPSWRAFGTVTGRLACRAPNVMNLPHASGDVDIRRMYIPAPGCTFVYFDVGQAEMRFAAYLSEDERFIEECETKDPYVARALALFPEAVEVLRTDPKGKGKPLRQIAKRASLAANYLVSAENLFIKLCAEESTFKGTLADVTAVLDLIHRTYRRYFEFVEENVRMVRRTGFMRTVLLGRFCYLGQFCTENDVANRPIQSGIADLMNERLMRIDGRLPRGATLVAQVHDSAVIEVRNRLVGDVRGVVGEVWDEPVVLPNGRTFKLPIDLKEGDSLGAFG